MHSAFDRVVNVTATGDFQLLIFAASSIDDALATHRLNLGTIAELGLRPGNHVTRIARPSSESLLQQAMTCWAIPLRGSWTCRSTRPCR